MTPSHALLLPLLFAAVAPGSQLGQATSPLQQAWEEPLGAARGADLLEVVSSAGGRALVIDSAGGVTALDPTTGALQWFVQMPAPLSHLPSDGGAIALDSGPTIVVVDGPTGRRLYQSTTVMAPASSPCSDGHILFVPALLDDALVAWDMQHDAKAWEFHMPAAHAGPALLCGPEGARSVLLPGEDGVLRAIPAQLEVPRGDRWSQRLGRVVGVPLLTGTSVVVATSDRAVACVDTGSGVLRWRVGTGEAPRTSPVAVGDFVAVATTGHVLLLRRDTGAIVWEQESSDRPLGEVGGGLLVRRAGTGGCNWLETATGHVLLDHLPGTSVALGGWLIELRSNSVIAGWKLAN